MVEVGTRVRIKNDLVGESTGIIGIEDYFNKEATVVKTEGEENCMSYHLDVDNGLWCWDESWFEPIESEKPAKIRGFEVVSDEFRKHKDVDIQLPTRGTKSSAGYDFYSTETIEIQPHSKVCVWSDVKVYMQEGEVLLLYVRSSIGIKRGLRLSNGTGVIDGDYFSNSDNDGNIGIALHNYTDEVVKIEKGERICQGIFIPFLVADNGNSDKEREGGIGSTNK